MKRSESFTKGALVLASAGLAVKVLGACFKIPLKNRIGAEGMGLFSTAYNLYAVLVVLSTVGLPVAISRMVAQRLAKGDDTAPTAVRRVASRVFLPLAGVCAAGMYFGAAPLMQWAGNPGAIPAVKALAPAVFFAAWESVCRGVCQGEGNMTPTAISQLIEALVRLLLGYGLADYCLKRGLGLEIAAAGAIFGVTAGSALGTAYLLCRKHPSVRAPWDRAAAEELLRVAVPVMLGSAVMSLTTLMDNFLVIRLLEASGASASYANARYGIYATMAVSLAALPQSLIGSLSVSLIPGIAGAWSAGEKAQAREQAGAALYLAGMLAIPCAAGMAALAQPLLELLFAEDGAEAAPLLRALTPGFLAICTATVTGAMLQAAGRELRPVRSMAAGAAVKLFATLFLIPRMGILGAPVSTTLCYAVIALGNLRGLDRLGLLPGVGGLWKPCVSALAMLAPILLMREHFVGRSGTVRILLTAVLTYGGVLYLVGGIPGKTLRKPRKHPKKTLQGDRKYDRVSE